MALQQFVRVALAAGFAAQGFDTISITCVTATSDPSTPEYIILAVGFRKALELVL